MKNIKIKASLEDKNKRIDLFLSEKIPDLSRSRLQRLIEKGFVLVNDEHKSKSYKINPEDTVSIVKDTEIISKNNEIVAQDIDIKILYEDDYLLVILKEPYVVTHPSSTNKKNTLANALYYRLEDKSVPRAGIVHRLDKNTSGLIIAAKEKNTQDFLINEFKERKVKKRYKALVLGSFDEKKGLIDMPIARSSSDRKKMTVTSESDRNALTEFKVKLTFKNSSLLDIYPMTGRTHQIRVHLSHLGHPVIGDEVYGNKLSRVLAKKIGLNRQFLHSDYISFVHPISKKRVEFKTDMPDDLKSALESLKHIEGS